ATTSSNGIDSRVWLYTPSSSPNGEQVWLLVERGHADGRRAVAIVPNTDGPRLAAHLAILDVFLRRTPAGIDRYLDGLVAVRAVHRRFGFRGAIAERKVGVEWIFLVGEEHPEECNRRDLGSR